jgi:hypothetical protein
VVRQEAHLVAEVPDVLIEILARFTRGLRASTGRPALRCLRAVLHRRRRDDRGVGAAPGHHSGEPEAVARVVDLETAVDVLGGKVEFEAGEEGRERDVLQYLSPLRRPRRPSGSTSAASTSPRSSPRSTPVSSSSPARTSPPQSSSASSPISGRARSTTRCASGSGRRRPASAPPPSSWRSRASTSPARSPRRPTATGRSTGEHPPPAGRSRYGRYADGPDPLAPPVDLVRGPRGDRPGRHGRVTPRSGPIREFLRRGGRDGTGLDDLARRVAQRRRDLLEPLGSVGPSRRSASCSTAPCSPSAVSSPETSRWTTWTGRRETVSTHCRPPRRRRSPSSPTTTGSPPPARETFERIKDLLGREMLDQRFAGMKQALESATDEDRQPGPGDARRPGRPARQARPR